jgi:hypothetical protein
MSASLKPKPTTARTDARTQRKMLAAERRRQAAKLKAEHEEAKDEALAPRIQRIKILGRDGEVIRGAQVTKDGITFRVSNPIARMVALQRNKEAPLLTSKHREAADRIRTSYEEGHGGVHVAISSYEQRASTTPQTGIISDGVLRSVRRQTAARAEIEVVRAHLGPLWGVVYSIAIAGIDVSAWASAVGMRDEAAAGYLTCALDRLVAFLDGPERRGRIRTIEITGLAPADD